MRAVAVTLALVALAGPARQHWRAAAHVHGIVDVLTLRDGTVVVSTRTGLFELNGSTQRPFAQSYTPGNGGEQYATAVPKLRTPACTWSADNVFVLDASATPGIIRVPRGGVAVRFFDFPKGGFPSGITFDAGGWFGHRLLVTLVRKDATTLYAIDCRGHGMVVARGGPHVEGGIAVAPRSFGRFAGRLIAANEVDGTIYAFDTHGRATVVARPNAPRGADIGVESLGFAPAGARTAHLADLGAPGSPTQGTDSLLTLTRSFVPGELVAVTEGGAVTFSVRCRRVCTSGRIAQGPQATHAEGHVAFGHAA